MSDYSVSVIIPVYNSEKYIEETIKSVCNQTYKNYEVILVDDESTDGSLEIANAILSRTNIKSKTIKQKNKGLPGARNTGIKHASGEYVCFIDSDDIISPTHLSDLVSVMMDTGANVAFSMFEYTTEANRFGRKNKDNIPQIYSKEEFLLSFMKRKPAVHCSALMIKLSLLTDKELLFNEELRKYGEDVEFMWRLFPNVNVIACTGKYTYKYLVRNNSLMTVGKTEPWDVFVRVFARSMKTEALGHPNLLYFYEGAFYRSMLGLLRIIAESSEYTVFLKYYKKLVSIKMISVLNKFPDLKIRLLVSLLHKNNRLYYLLFKKRIRY